MAEEQVLEERIAAGRALAKGGDDAASIALFQALVAERTRDPRVHYELACAFDRAGREEEAVLPYKQALALHLPEPYLQGALLGLDSTLRNVGADQDAVDLLTDACRRFPERADLTVFLALAQLSNGEAPLAVATLLDLIQASGCIDLHGYDRAIRWYTDDLKGVARPET